MRAAWVDRGAAYVHVVLDPDAFARRLAALPRTLLIALDVDGTLAPIVRDPSAAGVPVPVAKRLRRLSRADGIAVAIVTGRDARQLAEMLDVPEAWCALEHGRRVVAPGKLGPSRLTAEEQGRLARFRSWVRARAVPAGARSEEKEGSISVHVRELAAHDPQGAIALLAEARAAARSAGLYPREGRAVMDAELVPADKRRALEQLMAMTSAASCLYAGDDRTDDAAIALASERGIGLFVRSIERPEPPPGTTATLEGPSDVWRMLELLERGLEGPPKA